MNFLLDTNACIAVMNSRPLVVRQRSEDEIVRGAVLHVSVISIVELRYGVAKSERVEANVARLEDFLKPVQILPFDDEDAKVAGNIRAELELQGRPIGPFDCLIAAQGLRRDLCVVTANVREFSRVRGLRWEDWTA